MHNIVCTQLCVCCRRLPLDGVALFPFTPNGCEENFIAQFAFSFAPTSDVIAIRRARTYREWNYDNVIRILRYAMIRQEEGRVFKCCTCFVPLRRHRYALRAYYGIANYLEQALIFYWNRMVSINTETIMN